MKYMITWNERPQGSPIGYKNAQKRIRCPAGKGHCQRPRDRCYLPSHDPVVQHIGWLFVNTLGNRKANRKEALRAGCHPTVFNPTLTFCCRLGELVGSARKTHFGNRPG